MAFRKINVFIVEDSEFFRTYLTRQLEQDGSFAICGTAGTAAEALERVEQARPDIITLDLQLPDVAGFELLTSLTHKVTVPIVVVSSLADESVQSLELGAADCLPKVTSGDMDELRHFVVMLQIKLKMLAGIKTVRPSPVRLVPPDEKPRRPQLAHQGRPSRQLIAIGASLGGVEATQKLLQSLPPALPGMVIVQHMPPGFTKAYAQRLDATTPFTVREVENGDIIEDGTVLIACGGKHLQVLKTQSGFRAQSVAGTPVNGFCPSVDTLFRSVAKAAGPAALGVILTGIGCDGAAGMKEMHDSGAHTLGQCESSCIVYGMPAAARKAGAVDEELTLEDIGKRIASYF